MPSWPDILSKYNIILSQSHNFSSSLLAPIPAPSRLYPNSYEKIAVHPNVHMSDAKLDNDVIPLLRNQQTTDVLRSENETVRRLSEHMVTRGSLGVLLGASTVGTQRKPEYEDVIGECDQIKREHDTRVDRAVKAVTMLREKYYWRQRVEVEVEEPEELEWDPRLTSMVSTGKVNGDVHAGEEADGMDSDGDAGQSSSDEDEVEGELVHTPDVSEQRPTGP